MHKLLPRNIYIISIAAVALFLMDTFYKPISSAGLILLGLAALPFMIPLFRSVELPGGLKFELREIVREAKDTIAVTRRVATLTVRQMLSIVNMTGRMGGYSDDERESMRKEMLEMLQDLQVSKKEQEDLLFYSNHRYEEYDYFYWCIGGSRVQSDIPASSRAEWDALVRRGIGDQPSADDIENFFRRSGILNQVRKERIEDYRWYIKNREPRRRDIWRGRDSYMSKDLAKDEGP